jgi:IS1 family transposase
MTTERQPMIYTKNVLVRKSSMYDDVRLFSPKVFQHRQCEQDAIIFAPKFSMDKLNWPRDCNALSGKQDILFHIKRWVVFPIDKFRFLCCRIVGNGNVSDDVPSWSLPDVGNVKRRQDRLIELEFIRVRDRHSNPSTLILSGLPLHSCNLSLKVCSGLDGLLFKDISLTPHFAELPIKYQQRFECNDRQYYSRDDTYNLQNNSDLFDEIFYGTLALFGAIVFGCFYWQAHYRINSSLSLLLSVAFFGLLIFGYGFSMVLDCLMDRFKPRSDGCQIFRGWHDETVPQEYFLTSTNYWGTVIVVRRMDMANVLSMEKRIAVISALAEGSGIRQIERMTGINRNTIMNLGVRVGQGCAGLMNHKMRNLSCEHLQFDELWGFIGKKQKHVLPDDNPELGDVWTFCAIDSDTKLVPSFKVGKRDMATANAFVSDVASRMANRIQISTDGLPGYVEAVERAFGMNVDYAQIVKIFESEAADAEVIRMEKKTFAGRPDLSLASTSHVERLNGTTRLHMRRLTRLTYAFSKKKENFEAAVALHFAYYNFVKRHNTLRVTPAMEAGIERDFWTVGNLIEAAA